MSCELQFLPVPAHTVLFVLAIHYHHHRLRLSLKKADKVVAANPQVAVDLVRYYFVPKEIIVIRDQEILND